MKIQIGDEVIEASAEQIAHIEKIRLQPSIDDQIAAHQAKRQSALNKLIDLGLTEEEISSL